MPTSTPELAAELAIEQAGGPSAVGRALGISPQAVGQWRRIPAERVIAVEALSGVSRHLMRPDIYPVAAAPQEQVSA
jgi:DNA-binding transcriptional regulator YdaS (Cro superfamily)